MNLCGGCGTTAELRKSASYSDSVFQLPPALTSRSSDDSLKAQVPNLPVTPHRSHTPIIGSRRFVPEDASTPARTLKTPMHQTPPSTHMPSATPSPGLLNPLDGWKDVPNKRNKLFWPTLDRFTTLDSLIKRLEAGFSVVRTIVIVALILRYCLIFSITGIENAQWANQVWKTCCDGYRRKSTLSPVTRKRRC